MIKQNKTQKLGAAIFLVVLLLSFVSAADANNVSVMYGQNSSGALIPVLVKGIQELSAENEELKQVLCEELGRMC